MFYPANISLTSKSSDVGFEHHFATLQSKWEIISDDSALASEVMKRCDLIQVMVKSIIQLTLIYNIQHSRR